MTTNTEYDRVIVIPFMLKTFNERQMESYAHNFSSDFGQNVVSLQAK